MLLTRRRFLALIPPALGTLVVAACGGDDDDASTPAAPTTPAATSTPQAAATATATATSSPSPAASELAPTPACDDDDEPTIAQTEGPYFTPNSPERSSLLESGMPGTVMVLQGYVLSTRCEPIEGALVDFWQADDAGQYDNAGYTLRGHQFTAADGAFRLETIVPGLYPGRTRHIHVKVQAPNQPVLTTQLYFPEESRNATDGIYRESLLMEVEGSEARFDFVLEV